MIVTAYGSPVSCNIYCDLPEGFGGHTDRCGDCPDYSACEGPCDSHSGGLSADFSHFQCGQTPDVHSHYTRTSSLPERTGLAKDFLSMALIVAYSKDCDGFDKKSVVAGPHYMEDPVLLSLDSVVMQA